MNYFSILLWFTITIPHLCLRLFSDPDGIEYDNLPWDTLPYEYWENATTMSTLYPWNIRRHMFRVYNPTSSDVVIGNITYIETLNEMVIYEDYWDWLDIGPHNTSLWCIFKPRDPDNPNITQEFGIILEHKDKVYITHEFIPVRITFDEYDETKLILKVRKKELHIRTDHGRLYKGRLYEFDAPALRRLKTYLRSTLKAGRLNNVAVLNIHQDYAYKIDDTEIINRCIRENQKRAATFSVRY